MKKRRVTSILALGLSAVLLVSQLGCGSGVGAEEPSEESKTTQAEASQETVEEAEAPIEKGDPFGKYEEPVKVTAMTSIATTASATDYENSLWSAKMRELFNIDIEYVFLAAKEQHDERVNLMLASGDLPDVMNAVSYTHLFLHFFQNYPSYADPHNLFEPDIADYQRIPCIHGELCHYRRRTVRQYFVLCALLIPQGIYIL